MFSFMKQSSRWFRHNPSIKDGVVIAVMGPTGAGKTSFINKATGKTSGVSHTLESGTDKIQLVKFQHMGRSDLDIIFVDTPGFDDASKSDREILYMIDGWLRATCESNVKLAGILYFHRITDNRMDGTPLKSLRMFQQLCGSNDLRNVALVTTMWDDRKGCTIDEAKRRERELRNKYWTAQESHIYRYYNTRQPAWDVLGPFLEQANQRFVGELRKEMMDLTQQARKNVSGRRLADAIENLVEKQIQLLARIRSVQRDGRAPSDGHKLEYEETRAQLQDCVGRLRPMRVPIGKRLERYMTVSLEPVIKNW